MEILAVKNKESVEWSSFTIKGDYPWKSGEGKIRPIETYRAHRRNKFFNKNPKKSRKNDK